MRLLIAGIAVLSFTAAASAGNLKVPSTTYPTIQAAADAAASGDHILVGKGVYEENVVLNQSNVQLIGHGAILDGNIAGTDGDCLTVTGDGCSVTGMTFRHGNRHILATGNDFHVTKCRFWDTRNYVHAVDVTGNGAIVTGCTSFGALDVAINITGNDATVSKNKISQCGNNGIIITGTGALVTGNTIWNVEDSYGIETVGSGAVITKNRISYLDGSGIYADSDGCLVEKNTLLACGDYCIDVYGDGVTLNANKVSFSVDDADGIYVQSRTATGGGSVTANKVTDGIEYGFYLNDANNMTVQGNTVQRCGSEKEPCFYLRGNGNTITGNTAQDGEDDGFYVEGSANSVTANRAVNCLASGFDISGAGNTVDHCVATGCFGQGLINRGTGTIVTNCIFLKNRIDLSADLIDGATFGVVSGNTISSGGVTTQSEIQ